MYKDQEITPATIRIFPVRLPENCLPCSIMGRRTTIATPINPIIIPKVFLEESLSPKTINVIMPVRKGTPAYNNWPIVAVVYLIPKINNITLKVANRVNGARIFNFLAEMFLCLIT